MTAFACLGPTARPDAFGNYEPCPGYPCDACLKENEMQQISVTVNAPEGLQPVGVTVRYEPATAAEFDEIVDALGGPGAFTPCGSFAFAFCDGFTAHVQTPKDSRPVPAPSPFMDAFSARIDEAREARERVEQMT